VRCERGKHTNNNPKSKKNKKQAAAMAAAHGIRTRFGRRAVSASWVVGSCSIPCRKSIGGYIFFVGSAPF
jgi:hypothetical protein